MTAYEDLFNELAGKLEFDEGYDREQAEMIAEIILKNNQK
jgi:hypothetical protein